MDRIITGIELGENKVRVAVGRHRPGSTRMLAYATAQSAGIENQAIIDAHQLAAVLTGISRKMRTSVDFPFENAVFVVPSGRLEFHETEASIRPSGSRGSVTEADGERLVDKSRPAFAANARHLIHVIPQVYSLDGKESERLPVGKTGGDLSVLSMSVSCDASTAASIREVAELVDSDRVALMAGTVAESHAALTEAERERGAVVLSVGERMSTVTVMHYGRHVGAAKIGIGAYHFANDLTMALGLPYPTAQAVLDQVTSLSNPLGPSRSPITVGDEDMDIDRAQMLTTLQSRAEEFLSLTETAIDRIAGDRELPGGVIIAGRPILRDGLAALARSTLALPAHWAAPRGIEGIPSTLSDGTAWVPAIGTLAWAGTQDDPLGHPWFQPATRGNGSTGALSPWRRLARRLSGRNGHALEEARTSSKQSSERAARRKNAAVARGNDRRERRREIAQV